MGKNDGELGYLSYFGKLGVVFNQIKGVLSLDEKLSSKNIGDTLSRLINAYLNDPFEDPYKIMTTDNVAESLLFEIQDTIKSYDGDQEFLDKAWRWLENLSDKMVLNEDKTGTSLMGGLLQGLAANKNFAIAFSKYGHEKLDSRIKNLLQENDYKKQESLFYKFGSLVDLAEIKRSLFHHFKLKGDISKALFYGESLKKNGQLKKDEVSKYESVLKESGLTEVAIGSTYEFNPGSISKQIVLPSYHVQYWRHYIFDFVQTAEVYKKNDSIFINTASDTIVLDAKSKKEIWSNKFGVEYHQSGEGGPYQKRFPVNFFGNQMTVYGPTIDAFDKSVLCFKNDGTFLWDSAQFSDQISLEPVCNTFYSAGKLFVFTITKSDTIKVLYLTTIDPVSGKYLSSIPISKLSTSIRNTSGYSTNFNWNTYRHDEHFTYDGDFIYAYTGTGVTLKVDPISGGIVWAKAYTRMSNAGHNRAHIDNADTASGYICENNDSIISVMPDIQMIIGLDAFSGKENWTSVFNFPQLIHSRSNKQHFIFSKNGYGKEAVVASLDFKTGKDLWRRTLHGLVPTGEGQAVGGVVAIPVHNGIVVLDIKTGDLIKHINTEITFDKIRILDDQIVLFSKFNVWFLNNDGNFNQSKFAYKIENEHTFVEPNVKPSARLMMDNPDVESTFTLFERYLSGSSSWTKTNYFKTSKPFYHILQAGSCIMLFNEGFTNSNNKYTPPGIVWQELIPNSRIVGDCILISKPGVLSLEDLFSRKVIWKYQYEMGTILAKKSMDINATLVDADGKFIALQLTDGSVRILDFETQKILFHIPFNDASHLQLSDGVLILRVSQSSYAYDLNNKGAYLWTIKHSDNAATKAEDGMYVCVNYHPSYTTVFYDIKSGEEKFKVKCFTGNLYSAEKWILSDDFVFMYDNLYYRKTGSLIENSKEAVPVKNGGYLCFKDRDGQVGFYFEGNKKYEFKLNGNRSKYNQYIAAIKKGDEIFVLCPFFSERFKIEKDKLVSVDLIDNSFAKYGDHGYQRGMNYYALDDSFLILRYNEISFIRDFSKNEVLNTFETFQVSDDITWPRNESYPETEISMENWVSAAEIKPSSQIFYQIGVNSDYVFMKFRINKKSDNFGNKISHQLKIRGSQGSNISYIFWDYDKWETAQASSGLDSKISSWRQIDTHGNLLLFLKMKHSSWPLSSRRFDNVGQLGIEFVQMENGVEVGFYRMGGAPVKQLNPFPWKMRYSYHAKLLHNVMLRENLYDQLNSIYPQGEEITAWLASRRKIVGVKNNIKWLKKAIVRFKDSFAVVNFISALVLEEIVDKNKTSDFVTKKSYKKIIEKVLVETQEFCLQNKIKKEWLNLALTVITFEVYPNKNTYTAWPNEYDLAVSGIGINFDNLKLFSENYDDGGAVFESPLHTPHLVYFLPGLLSGYPKKSKDSKNELKLIMLNVCSKKSNFGEMVFFKSGSSSTIITQEGSLNGAYMILGKNKVVTKPDLYYWQFSHIPVFNFDQNNNPDNLVVVLKDFSMPELQAEQELTEETIKISLDNLPTDSNIGYELISLYKNLKKDSLDETGQLKDMFISWIKNLKNSSNATISASRQIFEGLKIEDKKQYLLDIWKAAKVPVMTQRSYFLHYYNRFNAKGVYSFMGPIEGELKHAPNGQSDFNEVFETESEKYKFENEQSKDRSGYAYWGTKIFIKDKGKATLLFSGSGRMSNSVVSVWLNDKQLVENDTPSNYSRGMLSQVLALKPGENVLLLKIDPADNRGWHNYNLLIGDHNGNPKSDLVFKPLVDLK